MNRPNCYMCEHRIRLQGEAAFSGCANNKANVVGAFHGVQSGWFYWPENFDPVWLESCDGFKLAELTWPDRDEGERVAANGS